MAPKAAIYFINGFVELNGTDVATISEIDSAVTVVIKEEQKQFKGSRIAAIETHTVGVEALIKISKPILKQEILKKLLGMNQVVGTLKDGTTASSNNSLTLTNYFQRPEVSLRIVGKDDKTGKILEIEAPKAVMTNDLNILLSKDDFAQAELEFLVLGDTDNPENSFIEIRYET